MEKRLTTFRGYTSTLTYDPASRSFVTTRVQSDFAALRPTPKTPCATKTLAQIPRISIDHSRIEPDDPTDHPRFV